MFSARDKLKMKRKRKVENANLENNMKVNMNWRALSRNINSWKRKSIIKGIKEGYKLVKWKREQEDITLKSLHVYNNTILNCETTDNCREELINLIIINFNFNILFKIHRWSLPKINSNIKDLNKLINKPGSWIK